MSRIESRFLRSCHPVLLGLFLVLPIVTEAPADDVMVEILEGIPAKDKWDFQRPEPSDIFSAPAFGFVAVPKKYNDKGLVIDRTNPYLLRAHRRLILDEGEYRVLLRSHGAARLMIDDELVAGSDFLKKSGASHEPVPKIVRVLEPGMPPLPVGHQERMTTIQLEAGEHDFLLEAFVGGKSIRAELGELSVCIARPGETLVLLGASPTVLFTEEGWSTYAVLRTEQIRSLDDRARRAAEVEEVEYWAMRHDLARREMNGSPSPKIPTVSDRIPVWNAIDAFIGARLEEMGSEPTALTGDHAFQRRLTLDTVGVVPTKKEIQRFFRDAPSERRALLIDRLLDDERWADNWVGYWQDVLAENPALLKPKLNNTGPFRWWIHQSLRDNESMDRFVTELVMMDGSLYGGGPAGFGLATMNDVPMASKAHIIAKAFLGLEMQCARCHDAPYQPFEQEQLFSLGAMLERKPLTVPMSSSVSLEGRSRVPAVEITLAAGSAVEPAWPFDEIFAVEVSPGILRDPKDPREYLAACLTSATNQRFAQVIVNRLWKRYLGWGLVEPVDDWLNVEPSHPKLLDFLARELVIHDYDSKYVAGLILKSHTYQRAISPRGSKYHSPRDRLFASPARRRMSAEQVVDSIFLIAGKPFFTEELILDPEGRRSITQFLNLGMPRRAWEFCSLSNDRDRPSLSLPFAQCVVDILMVFGWRESRQNPITVRDDSPNILQPMVLANGTVGRRITTLSDEGDFTELCLGQRPLSDLVGEVFLKILSRPPTNDEEAMFVEFLYEGYEARRVIGAKKNDIPRSVPLTGVSWANHLSPEASRIKLELAKQARAGDMPTKRLDPDWRERMEDMIWSLVNSPEFIFIP